MATASPPAPYNERIEPSANAKFPAEKGRYHLYVAYSCPFACRALAARNLKGLASVIGLSVVHPVLQKTKPDDDSDTHRGWMFVDPKTTPTVMASNGREYPTTGCTPDTVNHTKFVRDLYEMVDKRPRKFSVPVLWDKKTQTIVSEESTGILRSLDEAFSEMVTSNVQLYPEELRAEIDTMNDGIVAEVTSAYLEHMFGKTLETGEAEIAEGYASVAKLDKLLSARRYLVGSGITEADVRLFHTLIRMDVGQLKASKQNITQFPNVVGYLRDLYQMPGFKSTVNWDHLKFVLVNHLPNGPEAEGPFVDYDAPHERAQLA